MPNSLRTFTGIFEANPVIFRAYSVIFRTNPVIFRKNIVSFWSNSSHVYDKSGKLSNVYSLLSNFYCLLACSLAYLDCLPFPKTLPADLYIPNSGVYRQTIQHPPIQSQSRVVFFCWTWRATPGVWQQNVYLEKLDLFCSIVDSINRLNALNKMFFFGKTFVYPFSIILT